MDCSFRSYILAAGVVFGLALGTNGASAVPLTAGTNFLSAGADPLTAQATLGSGQYIGGSPSGVSYTIVPVGNVTSDASASVLNVIFTPGNTYGVANATLSLSGPGLTTTPLHYTDAQGVFNTLATSISASLLSGVQYVLTLTGQALSGGGQWNMQISATGPGATTPLPGALLLFGTGLLGAGLFGSRRRSRIAA